MLVNLLSPTSHAAHALSPCSAGALIFVSSDCFSLLALEQLPARRLSGPTEPKGPSALPGKRISARLSGPRAAVSRCWPAASRREPQPGALHPRQHPAGAAHLWQHQASPGALTRWKAVGPGCERRNPSLQLSAPALSPLLPAARSRMPSGVAGAGSCQQTQRGSARKSGAGCARGQGRCHLPALLFAFPSRSQA